MDNPGSHQPCFAGEALFQAFKVDAFVQVTQKNTQQVLDLRDLDALPIMEVEEVGCSLHKHLTGVLGARGRG